MSLRRDDVNFATGEAKLQAESTKGKRAERVVLHPSIIEHLKPIASFDPLVFPWSKSRRAMYVDFQRIQDAASDATEGPARREDGDYYTFHYDFRRAFATMNAEGLSADALQRVMRHRDYQTTQRYINMAQQTTDAVDKLFVPEILRSRAAVGGA